MNKEENKNYQCPDSSSDLYAQLGVKSDKSSVAANFKRIIKNLYPNAFVNITKDPSDPQKCFTMHVDGDGSKFIQRILDYYEHGDPTVFKGVVDDGLSMNTSDIAAAGFVGTIRLVDVFDCGNADLKDIIIDQMAQRFQELFDLYKEHGFDIEFMGGETADLPYQVKSGVFNVIVSAWTDKDEVITGDVKVGDTIIGLYSDGQAKWEEKPNFAGMSNGMTLLRGGSMDKSFNEKYADLGDGHFYKGKYHPDDCPEILGGTSIGEAILSPTRQWALVIKKIINALKERNILHMLHGISINTGGGATKIANIGENVTYVKNMPEPSSLFRFIQSETGQPWRHMYTTFNCTIGVDIVGENDIDFKNTVKQAVEVECGLKASELGFVNHSFDENNHVILNTLYGRFEYDK